MHVPGAFNYVANGVVNHNTGIGKGRVVAATIRYAIRKGWTPVFVTEKPDLYGDMFRDMADIGLRKMLGHEPRALMTNTGESVPLDEEALAWKQEADQARADGQPIPKRRGRFLTAGGKPAQEKAMQAMASGKGQHDIVFTTYDQMNTIKKQETDRRRFLRQIMPNSLLILDESHNAGGQGEKRFKAKHGDAPDRAEYVRGLVKDAAGVVYSSATFAKRPDVMDLYARTDMGKAVDDPKMLPALIQKGGVPMQQIVASMLSNAGQYMRRERSFEGVEYAVEPVPVDEKTYKQFSDAVRAVFEFDLAVEDIRDKVMEDILDKMGATKAKDAGVGGGSANSIAFAAIMHNIVNQMLLSIKARQVAQRAIDAHKAGEKPVIALAGTMESFISDYAEDAGISIGQPIAISFGDVLQRYLSRTLRITVKDSDNQKKHVQIPISDLPPSLQRKYAEAEQLIKEGDFDSMPVSPIDAIRHELTSAGLSVAEVTGRKVMIDYGAKGNSAVLIDRPKSEIGPSGKRSSIAAFNRGGLDALILNRSGSTGVSMHASKAFKDQSPRRMIIAQAEANIDTHCLDAKTEILTPDGFKGIDDAFDTVAAIDPVSGAVAWRPVTGRVKRALGADETMFGIQSPGLDIRVTNNHRMLMKHRRQSVGWRFETAEDIGRRRSNWRLPVSGVQIPEKSLNLTDHELRFIGWVLTDGSINYKSRQIVIWQAEHQPYHDDIRACIEGCGFKYGVTENRGKTQHVRNSRSIGYVISLGQWRHLKEYLDKDFPIAFEHLDRRQLSVLLEALHLGDGTKFNNQPWTRRSYHIASGRKTFADRLQSLCIRRGYRCNVSEMNYNLNPLYMVRIKDKNEQSVGGPTQDDGRPTFGPVSFDAGETVWCVENELGTLITRRNGKVAFVGNCQMLGRVHRTGQVRTPSYTQIAAEIPAEARPTAVLMKKMASLNANTTGARGSVFMADSIDFMNDVGDKVVANIIQDEPEINAKLGNPLKENVKGLPVSEDAARRVTGRLVLLTPKEQTELLNRIQDEYKAEIERLDALGENALEAKTVDLKARHIETTALKDRTGEGPFLDSAQIEKVSIKSQGRAMAPKEVAEKISEALEITTPEGEGAAQLAVLERSGREWMNKKIGDVRSRSQSWIASDVASKSDDAKVTTKKRHDDQLARWIQTAQVVAPGARVTLQLGDRQMHAIVLSVARTGKAKNPVALGAWTATMAVPDSVRTLTLPFSQLFPPSQVKGSEESGAEVRFSQVPFTGLISQLEDARREDREDRYIVTGNILAGYEQVRGKGRIVNFTMKDGSLRPGVLMGRDFELDKFLERRAVRFRSADQVVTFMTRAPGAQVRSIDKFVTLSRTGSGWQIDMPSGRATGGRYFTDKRVRDAISPDDFSRVGGVMGVRLYDVQKFKAAVEAMLKIGAMFETTEDQEIAQEVIRDGKPPMPKSEPVQSGKAQSETARAISDFAKGVADLKQRTGVQTRQRGDNEPLAAVTGRALEKLTTPSMKAEVAKTQGVSAAYRADGMFFSQSEVGGAVDLRDQIEKAVAAGESFDVPHWHVQDQMEAIRPNLHMFPAGTITGVLHRIDPIDAENVKLHFRTPDGKNKTMGYPLKEIGQSRALALPSRFLGRPIFFAINITIGKQTANAVSGEVWHEAFHILRREGYIRGDRWARLLRHAKKLRVFDMAFRDVLGKIKDPTAQWAPDGITLRQVYAKLYHGRDDHVEVMHQEEITHMIELWHHGALTDADVAPVMDILNDMGSGKIAGNQTTSQTDMDRILFGEGYFAASGPAASIGQWLDWAENLGDKQIQIKDRNGKAYTIERVGRFGSITYTVMDGRKTVGSFYVRTGGAVPGTISVMNALIERGYQRRGLASAVYDAIEADTAAGGRPLYPQGRYSLSEDGRAFWQARDPAKLAEMDRVDSEPGYAYGQAVRVALDRPAQTKLKTEISEAIAIVQRIAGNGVHIDFKSQIPARAARQAVADVEAFRAAGRAGDFIGGFYRPEMAHLEALIGLSVEAPGFDLRTAAGHEAWHHVERVFATDAELRVLYSPAEQARMRKLVAVELGLDPDNSRRDAALLAVMPQVEVTAYAFQRYRRLREEGMASMNGLHIAVRRLFERVYKIFQNIKGVVTSEGLTYETIFETARTGAMAKRQRRDRRSHGRVAASGVGNLDMSPEARKARAEEMGFDTSKVWYHSSLSPIEAFEPHGKFMGRWGVSGISLTNNPKMASRYLDRYGDVNYKGVPFQKNVMPLYVKRGLRIKEITTPIKQKLGLGFPLPEGYKWPKELDGYDGILVRDAINGQDVVEGSDAALLRDLELDDFEGKVFHTDETDPGAIAGYELILRDPSNIRSVNAAFDPALYDSASLLAQSLPSIEAIIQSVVDKAANTNTNIATHAALFVDQYLTFDEGQSTTSGEMYDAYKIWAKNANVEAGDEQAFHRAMISHGGMSRMRIAGRTRYLGVRIASKLGRKVADANALMPVEKRTLAQDIAQGFSFSAALSRVIDAMKAKVGGSAASAETVKQIADVNRLIAVQDQIVSENDNDVDRVVADNIYAMFDNPDILAAAIPSSPGVARPMSWLERRARRMFARLGERGDAIRVRLQDKALPIKRLAVERVEAETGTSVPPSLDTYLKEALYSGRAGERMIDLEQDQIEPLIEHMRNEGISLDDLGDYLYARHARERNAWIAMINDELPDGGSGMTNAEADQTLADVRASGKQAAMDEAARRIDKMIENTRKDLLKAGLIDRETFDNWSQKYAAYVPLRGFDIGEDENPDFPRVGRGYDVRGREAFAALGRRSKADNPVIYAVQQAQQAIVRAEKNRVNKTLYNAVKSYPNESFWKIYNGELRRRLNPSTGLVEEYWVPPQFVRRDDVIGVKLNGKQKWIELKHPALARSLRGVGSDVSGSAIGRVAHKVMRTYAGLLTSYNPEFVASNFFRDVQTAIINATGLQNKPAGMRRKIAKDAVSAAAIRGALAAIRNHEGRTIFGGRRAADETILGTKRSSTAERYARYYDEFRRAGGKVSFIEFNDVERIRNKTLSALKAGRVRRGLRLAAESVEHLNTAVENGVRLSTYVTLREAGVSQDEAAFAAKELTVNFNRKGEWGPGINALYLFFNASVQGITRMARAITTSSKVRYALGGLLAFGAMLDMLNYLAAGDDDDGENRYDKIPHWVKERNLIIMNPLGDGNYLMIPLPYGYNTPFLAGQEAMSVIRGVSKPEEAAGRVLLATLEAFNPMGSAGSFLQYASPTLLDPAVQIMENRNWFGGRIMPKKFDDREPDSQAYFDSAPGWAKEVARILNEKSGGNIGRPGWADFSPETIEHWAEFAGGGTATFFFNAIATAERFVDGEEWLPEKAPMVRRLYGRQDSSVSRKREFYDAWSDVNQVHYEIKELMKSGDREAAITARDTYKPEVQAYNAMKGAQKQLKALRAARGAIETRTDLDAATKRERLDDITAKEKRVVMRSLKVYEDAKKAAGR